MVSWVVLVESVHPCWCGLAPTASCRVSNLAQCDATELARTSQQWLWSWSSLHAQLLTKTHAAGALYCNVQKVDGDVRDVTGQPFNRKFSDITEAGVRDEIAKIKAQVQHGHKIFTGSVDVHSLPAARGQKRKRATAAVAAASAPASPVAEVPLPGYS